MSRKPFRFLHYRGDVTEGVPPAMGPDSMGQWLYPVAAAHDPNLDVTTVGLSYLPPEAAA